MEEVDGGSFELKWARIDGIVNPKDCWRGQGIKTKLDVVRPGRYVVIIIICHNRIMHTVVYLI